ncbi:hypothetical protein [Bradyrhizobium sp. USDA 4503]
MRNAAGELADRFHLLRLADLALIGLGLAKALEQEFRSLALASLLGERDMASRNCSSVGIARIRGISGQSSTAVKIEATAVSALSRPSRP